jgi:hypothetical protein
VAWGVVEVKRVASLGERAIVKVGVCVGVVVTWE